MKKRESKRKIKLAYDHLSLLARQYGVSGHTKEQIEQYYAQLEDQLDSFTDIYKVDATISQSDSFKERYEGIISQEIADWKKRQKPEVIIDGGEK